MRILKFIPDPLNNFSLISVNLVLSGKEISDKICTRIIETVENHPYYAQQFARNIWLISGRVVSKSDFQQAKKALISDNLNFYNEMLEDFTSYQIGLLKALLYKENHLYSAKVIHAYRLGSTANVRRMYKAFENKGIIVNENGKVVFADPIFKLIAEEQFLKDYY